MRWEKPICSACAQSTMDVASAPDCVMNATCPSSGIDRPKLALMPRLGTISPRQFGPSTRIPSKLAARSATCRSSAAPCLAGLAEPRRQDRHGRYSGPPAFIHDIRHRRRRCADHGKVGCRGRVTHAGVGLHPVDGLTLRVDRVDHPLVARLEQVPQDDVANVRGRRTRSDDGYAARCEQLVEVANAHIRPSARNETGSENPLGQLHHPRRVPPFVVVPGDHLHLGSVDDARQGGIEDG